MTSKKSIIASIPHTGTRFLKRRLGIEQHVHTHMNWNTILEQVKDKHIIVPMRKPDTVWRSWCRRRAEKQVLNWVEDFFLAYGIMHTFDQMFDLDFICIDKQEDPRITDWGKVGDEDSSDATWKLHKVDIRHLYKLPFVQRHYASHLI